MNASETLTNEEMSALLSENDKEGAAGYDRDKRRRITLYNFRRPDRLSKEQVRSLYLLHDLFAHSLSSSLPLFLRAVSEVTLVSVEQQSYAEYLRGLSDPSVLFSLALQPLHGIAAIEFSPAIAFPVIDRMLGGTGQNLNEDRPATEIEQKVLEGFLLLVTDSFKEVWKPICELEMQVVGCETRPQMLQIVAPNEVVVSIALHVQIGDAKGSMSICLPVILLEPVIEKFTQTAYSRTRETLPEQTHELLNSLSITRFPVAAELNPFRVAVEELLALSAGDVLRTNHRIDKPVNLDIGGTPRFLGRLASSRGHVVAQVSDVYNNPEAEPDHGGEQI